MQNQFDVVFFDPLSIDLDRRVWNYFVDVFAAFDRPHTFFHGQDWFCLVCDRFVGVNSDEQRVTVPACLSQEVDVSVVKKVSDHVDVYACDLNFSLEGFQISGASNGLLVSELPGID
jgi:hypothetical protein